jgi:phosphoribosylaminoimidazolecarboxamide formyltransferase / IMP cyclohydrolase
MTFFVFPLYNQLRSLLNLMPQRALISVSDKSGIGEFAKELVHLGYEILSTGGTASALEKAGIVVATVDSVTAFPECFGGRVKTIHPKIMGGILFKRDDPDDIAMAEELEIEPIDIVVVNLYPFEESVNKGMKGDELIEQIDIGGPTLLRSAAKNHKYVTVIFDTDDYDRVIAELKNGGVSDLLRKELAVKVFEKTAMYDGVILETLSEDSSRGGVLTNKLDLRYGENPHQWGQYYDVGGYPRSWKTIPLDSAHGKQMSYLNILDADGAWNLVHEFSSPTAACIKHANPSGVASDTDISEAFQKSYDADRLSAFGVIIALNRACTKEIVERIIEQKIFTEVIIAPNFDIDALDLLKSKPKIRAIHIDPTTERPSSTVRSALGGTLIQEEDTKILTEDNLTYVTNAKPTDAQIADLLFSWKVVKHSKSNAIVFAKDLVTVGIGCGQTSRVDSTILAARRAGDRASGAVMASDAFFPFPDSVEEAHKHGISAIIQPGGSIKDVEVISKANELGIVMVTTGVRAFRH